MNAAKTLAYRNLDTLRETMRPILLRRNPDGSRQATARNAPTKSSRCEATAEQLEIHDNAVRVVAQIAAKKFMTEMDRLRMQKCLLLARMACDSTYLCDQEAGRIQQQAGADHRGDDRTDRRPDSQDRVVQ